MQLDDLDRKATTAFEGYVVRKDLVRTFSRQFPVPTYVVEFLLGRYCATTDEAEIQEGLEIVQRQLGSRTVKAGEEELFKARARESGSVKIIDIITARLDAKTDSYVATLAQPAADGCPHLTPEMVTDNERMLTGGFYAEIDAELRRRRSRRRRAAGPLASTLCGRSSCPSATCLDVLAKGRQDFSTAEWTRPAAAQRRLRAEHAVRAGQGRPAAAHGAVRRAQLQHGRARARAAPARATCSSRSRPMPT